ncbi:ABC transporter permease subunit [Fonticella tunisiensis]|uniref:ABC-2 family transporter n=1 Tax=Fonticella tunisiensis TaxID=1096341 RepID=A0A4R7KTC5_9CLOT|nr:ABC transporter permease subunit [Fonticella tunisiensis]TDT61138.1 hypothetical protein EDD71_10835 [Fonticella tunisiensis]
MTGHSNEEKLEKLQARYDVLQVLTAIANIKDLTEKRNHEIAQHYLEEYRDKIPNYIKLYESGNYLTYSGDLYSERQIIGTVLNEVSSALNYDQYLRSIDERAAVLSGSSLFAKPGTFSYRNIKLTPAAFAPLKGNVLQADISNGVITDTQSHTTDIIAVLLIPLTCMSLIMPEKENGLYSLIKPTVKGQKQTIFTKISAAFLLCILIEALLYGTNFIIAGYLFGFGNTERLIQSVTGLIGCPFVFTDMQYFVVYLLTKLAAYFLTSLLILFLCVRLKKSSTVYAGASIIFGANFALYLSIDAQSQLSFFKRINLVPFLLVTPIYREYININFFSYPVNIIPVTWMTFGLSLLSLCVLTMVFFCRRTSNSSRQKTFAQFMASRIRLWNRYPVNLLGNELYKQLMENKVLIILLIFALIQGYSYSLMQYNPSLDEQFYKQYMKVLNGELTIEKMEYLKQEQEKFDKAAEGLRKLGENYAAGEINNAQYTVQSQYYQEILQKQKAFSRVKEQADYIIEQRKNSKNPYFIYDTGFGLLSTAGGNRMDLMSSIKICLVLIVCISSIFANEYSTGTIDLLHVCKNGRGKTFASKLLTGLIIMLILYFLTYFPDFYFILSNYGIGGMNAPACSLQNLSALPQNISVLQYFILIYTVRLFAAFIIMLFIIAVSLGIKNSFYTMATATAVAVIPIMICLFGSAAFEKIPFTSLLIANILFQGNSILIYNLCFSIPLSIFLLAISYRKFCGIHTATAKYHELSNISS